MNTATKLGPSTLTVRGTYPGVRLRVYYKSRYNTGESDKFVLKPFVVAFVPVFPARMVHEVTRTEELAEQRLRVTAPITPGSRSKSTTLGTYLPPRHRG
jgi:hypothetical protein